MKLYKKKNKSELTPINKRNAKINLLSSNSTIKCKIEPLINNYTINDEGSNDEDEYFEIEDEEIILKK